MLPLVLEVSSPFGVVIVIAGAGADLPGSTGLICVIDLVVAHVVVRPLNTALERVLLALASDVKLGAVDLGFPVAHRGVVTAGDEELAGGHVPGVVVEEEIARRPLILPGFLPLHPRIAVKGVPTQLHRIKGRGVESVAPGQLHLPEPAVEIRGVLGRIVVHVGGVKLRRRPTSPTENHFSGAGGVEEGLDVAGTAPDVIVDVGPVPLVEQLGRQLFGLPRPPGQLPLQAHRV